jgi:hypothetical protein
MIVQKLKKDFFLNFLNYLVDFARQAVPLRGDDAGEREREVRLGRMVLRLLLQIKQLMTLMLLIVMQMGSCRHIN